MINNSANILKKISLLNKATIQSILEGKSETIVKNFTEASIKTLDADFGFAWWKIDGNEHKLAYKSLKTPYTPSHVPRRKITIHRKTSPLLYDPEVKKGNYEEDIHLYLKSYLIIPVNYGEHVYGSIVVCYKKKHIFTEENFVLSNAISNAMAQAVNTHWLIERQKNTVEIAEKQKATEVLLAQEKLKTEFIANATHEFRTPLAIMLGNVDLALKVKNKDSLKISRQALMAVNEEINHLSPILEDLALLTSGRNPKIADKLSPVNLTNILEEIVKRLTAIGGHKKISISLRRKRGENIFIAGEKVYLDKLFLNLIKNAITYGKQNGKILVDISKSKKEAIIKITDDGIGISKDDLPYIFERFFRADKSHTGKHSGLGLAIVNWVVQAHKGTITVTSSEGKGSAFTVNFPLSTAHRGEPLAPR